MKLVSRDFARISIVFEKNSGIFRETHISEPSQTVCLVGLSLHDAHLRIWIAFSIFHTFMEIHEAAAFRQDRHAGCIRRSDAFHHGPVPGELPGEKLRISAIKNQALRTFRNCRIMNR